MLYSKPKDKTAALLLCIFLGYLGIHRFYLGKVGSGLLYLFTGGLFCIGWIVDIVRMATGSFWNDTDFQYEDHEQVKLNPSAAQDIWDTTVHEAPGQSDRMRRAKEQPIQIVRVQKNGIAIVRGSTGILYQTGLGGCTCEDFKRRGLPCKHIYALAIETMGFDTTPYLGW